MVTIAGVGITLVAAFLISEIIGYFVHVLLHSNKVRFLSDGHMIHHLRNYGPRMNQRALGYKDAVTNRFSFMGFGIEWTLPLGIAVGGVWLIAYFIGIAIEYTILLTVFALTYSWVFFRYLHHSMHLENFWMLNNKFTRKWFLMLRKYHDIHHVALDSKGRMNYNFGICFFFFDRLFGTIKHEAGDFNEEGFKATRERYGYLFEE